MMKTWSVRVEVYPYATDAGAQADAAACGGRLHDHELRVEDADDALDAAKLFIAGIKTNPRVWQASVISLSSTRPVILPARGLADGDAGQAAAEGDAP